MEKLIFIHVLHITVKYVHPRSIKCLYETVRVFYFIHLHIDLCYFLLMFGRMSANADLKCALEISLLEIYCTLFRHAQMNEYIVQWILMTYNCEI